MNAKEIEELKKENAKLLAIVTEIANKEFIWDSTTAAILMGTWQGTCKKFLLDKELES